MSSLKSRREIIQKRIEIKQELLRRQHRKRQQAPGGLFEFVKYFWSVLEPKTQFVDGWAIRAICLHLEAVTAGRVTRLLINVPPGFSKSLICNVFFPAWEMGPKGLASMRYIAFSYGSHLTERDNGKFRDLIQSKLYRDLWGDQFKATGIGVVKVSNDKTGWKFASSVGGVGTGERADRVVCFPYDEMVETECGPMQIGRIVDERLGVKVFSLNRANGRIELQPVVKHYENPGSDLVKVKLGNGEEFRCTPNHKVLSASGSFVRADSLRPGDAVTAIDKRNLACDCKPSAPASNCAYGTSRDVVSRGKNLLGLVAGNDFINLFARQFRLGSHLLSTERAVSLCVGHVFGPRSIFKIVKSSICTVSVFMANLASFWARTSERFQDHFVGKLIPAFSANSHRDARVSLVENWRQDTARKPDYSALFARSNDVSRQAANAPKVRNFVNPVASNDGQPDFAIVNSVEWCGHAVKTYCLEVETNHNFILSSYVVVRNCDDAHNLSDGESDVIRTKTVRWFDEAMSNRLNDLQKSAIIVIMQRVHENDVSGHIIEHEDGYVHLLIPMEFDGRVCTTFLGYDDDGNEITWTDPRTQIGELAWPERYGDDVLVRFRRNAFMWAGQYQQTPEPRGGGLFKRDWWQYIHIPIGSTPPPRDYVVASLDSAYTKQERNDPSGFTVWQSYVDEHDNPKILMLGAWRKHLEIHGADVVRERGESDLDYRARCKKEWGLVEWVAYECKRHKVDMLLIEAKASGLSVAQEMQRLYANEGWGVELVNPEGDKYARAVAQIHLVSDGMVGVPVSNRDPRDKESELVPRDWAQLVIDELSMFPNGRYRDLTDSTTQALKHLRSIGLAIRRDERDHVRAINSMHTGRDLPPLYGD